MWFCTVVHLDHILVKFEYQGHWFKVKVTQWEMVISRIEHHQCLSNKVNVINQVKVIQGQLASVRLFYWQDGATSLLHYYYYPSFH